MKTLLKLFAVVTLTVTPVVTVVACGSKDNNPNPKDIQNSALALMRDTEFKMTDLGIATTDALKSLRLKKFKEFSSQIQDQISTFFANELKKSTNDHPTQWYYDDASVVLNNASIADNAFQIPLYIDEKQTFDEGSVNGHINVKVSVTYKNLPAISKNIKLTFNNDTTTTEKKTNAIKSFIEYKINTQINTFPKIDVATLPITDATDNQSTASWNLNNSIVPHLRTTIKNLIQYQDLSVIIMPYYDQKAPVSTSCFTIASPTIVDGKIQFNGTLKNIAIIFNIGDASSIFKIGDDKITVVQSETNAVNQISGAFYNQSQSTDNLPTAKVKKVKDVPGLEKVLINTAKDNIAKSYPDITSNDITITNENTATFTSTDSSTGYFILNFNVKHTYSGVSFSVDAQNIKVIVSKKK